MQSDRKLDKSLKSFRDTTEYRF